MFNISNFIKNTTNSIKQTIGDKVFYTKNSKDNYKTRFVHIVNVVFLLAFATLFIQTIGLFWNYGEISKSFESFSKQILNFFPNDLKLNYTNNELSVNQKLPYNLTPKSIEGKIKEMTVGEYSKLIVFDNKATSENFESYKSLFVANNKNLLTQSRTKIEVYPLSSFFGNGYSLDKAGYVKQAQKIKYFLDRPFLTLIIIMVLYAIFYLIFGTVWAILTSQIFIAVYSLLVLVIARLFAASRSSYSYFFLQGMYLYTGVLILDFIAKTFGFYLGFWVYALGFLILAYINLPEFKKGR